MRGAGQKQGDATEHRTENDPRSTTTEPGAGTIGEVAEHQVSNQGRHCGERIDDADEGVRIGAFDGLVVHRQQHGGDDAEARHPQDAERQEASAEADGVDLAQRLAGFRRQRRILVRGCDVGVVRHQTLLFACDCFTHETLSFDSCFSSVFVV